MGLEFASQCSSHILGTNDWSLGGWFHSVDGVNGTLNILVDVKGDDIRFLSLKYVELFISIAPIIDSGSDWLSWVSISGPLERLLQERKGSTGVIIISWFVIDVPNKNSFVILEETNNTREVLFKKRELSCIIEELLSWGLNPLWVVHSLSGFWLRS